MRVTSLRVRSLRTHAALELSLDHALTIVDGPNGAGKTNLLEAIVLAATGRSWRTRTDRELVRHGEDAGRSELRFTDGVGAEHKISLTVHRGSAERQHVLDGGKVELGAPRPLVVVFAPDRLALVQGSPQGRRGHVDQLVAALWPSRNAARAEYARALAQRNALLHRHSGAGAMDAWEYELARHGVALRAARQNAIDALSTGFAELASDLGLTGTPSLAYRPADSTGSVEDLAQLYGERRDRDRERGFTTVGPHRDEITLRRDDRDLRSFGSQGEQRLAVLALLLTERSLITEVRGSPPLALLDDVGSELDPGRRERLVTEVCRYGQVVIATTSAKELGTSGLPSAPQLVHVSADPSAEVPSSIVEVDDR